MKKVIVGVSGTTGIIYAVRVLEALRKASIETHLIISEGAVKVMKLETEYDPEMLASLASFAYDVNDLGAPIASGSFLTDGMVVVPCSIKSLSAIANSYSDNLLIRAADVTLKEKRKLVLVVRETPLHAGHLQLMLKASEIGAVILPPVPAFYHKPVTIDDLINQTVGKILDQFGIDAGLFRRWG
ncbi:MAG: UbiX family flavin prenyltransferase, partial [Desulfotomaculales bacterium]